MQCISEQRVISMLLINENENVKSSIVYVGFLILKELEQSKSNRISIYKIADILRKNSISHSRQLTLALTFLYSLGLIKFEEPYIWIEK